MQKLVENQFDENQVNENELEKLYGGSGDIECDCYQTLCKSVKGTSWYSDEDDKGNVIF